MAKLSVTQEHVQYLDDISLLNESVTNTLYRVLEEHKKLILIIVLLLSKTGLP